MGIARGDILQETPTPIADKFAGVASNLGIKAGDVCRERLNEASETDIVEELYGIASNVKMDRDDIRRERLARQEEHEEGLLKVVRECESGDFIGPFRSVDELMADLYS